MKTLYLLRHAKSSWADPSSDDHARELNKRGRRAAAAMAEHIAGLPEPPELILASDSVRTRETLKYLLDALPNAAKASLERELYLAPSQRLLTRLRRLDDTASRVLLLGHNPGLHELALRLAARGPRDIAGRIGKFPTAALVTFAVKGPWRDLDAGNTSFRAYVTPGDLSPEGGDDD